MSDTEAVDDDARRVIDAALGDEVPLPTESTDTVATGGLGAEARGQAGSRVVLTARERELLFQQALEVGEVNG